MITEELTEFVFACPECGGESVYIKSNLSHPEMAYHNCVSCNTKYLRIGLGIYKLCGFAEDLHAKIIKLERREDGKWHEVGE